MTQTPGKPSKPTETTLLTERLREDIVTGAIAPGAKLKLVPLAKRYEATRSPLREAALRLTGEGLVASQDQRGFWVVPISQADLLDVTQTRQRIEVLALQDAIAHGDLAWEGKVMAATHTLERVTDHDNSPEARALFQRHHRAFHEALVAACPSAYLIDFRERLFTLTERYRNLAADSYAKGIGSRDVAAEHRAIAEATVARDASTACALLADHLGTTAAQLVEAYPDLFEGGSP